MPCRGSRSLKLNRAFQEFCHCLAITHGQALHSMPAPVQLVAAFISVLTDPGHCRVSEDGTLNFPVSSTALIPLRVNYAKYLNFAARYQGRYTTADTRYFTEIADRLIATAARRFCGDFWTPSIWADKGVEYLENTLGPNWKEDFVVWDCCCGTKNLTRNYVFKKLYCSTLLPEELNLSKAYNPEAAAFQYDFLNDELNVSPACPPQKMPGTLYQELLKGRPLVFFCNPPYATANEMGALGKDKRGVAATGMQKLMRHEAAGKASQQLITQFLWRILKLKNDFCLPRVIAAFFLKPVFFSPSPYYNEFRKRFFSEFAYKKGFIFNAGEFSDVNSHWGITFCIFDSLNPQGFDPAREYNWSFEVLKYNQKKRLINSCGTPAILCYWPKEYSLSNWIREPVKNLPVKSSRCAQMSSAFKLSLGQKKPTGSLKRGALGYMVNVANNIYNSLQDVWIVSGYAYKGHGVSICPENFERCLVNFAARNVAAGRYTDFIHDKDEFHIPDTSQCGWREFLADCAAYTFFANQGSQSSVVLKAPDGFVFDIRNEFFPFARKEIASQSKEYCSMVYRDVTAGKNETYMYRWLYEYQKNERLSGPAQAVLEHARELIRITMPERTPELTEYHQERWDASWKQLKMLKSARAREKQTRIIRARLDEKILSEVLKFGIFRP